MLLQGRSRLGIRKRFCSKGKGSAAKEKVLQWLPREVLEAFRAMLDVALGSLVCWLATLWGEVETR